MIEAATVPAFGMIKRLNEVQERHGQQITNLGQAFESLWAPLNSCCVDYILRRDYLAVPLRPHAALQPL
jgi:hypothetical protein